MLHEWTKTAQDFFYIYFQKENTKNGFGPIKHKQLQSGSKIFTPYRFGFGSRSNKKVQYGSGELASIQIRSIFIPNYNLIKEFITLTLY